MIEFSLSVVSVVILVEGGGDVVYQQSVADAAV